MVWATVGSLTVIGWNRRSRAASFSISAHDEDVEEEPAHEPPLERERCGLCQSRPRLFNQLVIDHAARTGRFASATIQAQIQMPPHRGAGVDGPIRQPAHQLNPPARRIGFVSGCHECRTGRQAQSAMHARQRAVISPLIEAQRRIFLLGRLGDDGQCGVGHYGLRKFQRLELSIGIERLLQSHQKCPLRFIVDTVQLQTLSFSENFSTHCTGKAKACEVSAGVAGKCSKMCSKPGPL